jgi:hypothetical protein
MSDLLGFIYGGVDETPELGRRLDAHVTEEYGTEAVVSGHLAFAEDGTIIGYRVYVHAEKDTEPTMPHNDGKEAWEDFTAWMSSLGSTDTMTFYRRPHSFDGPPMPGPADVFLFDACSSLCPQYGLTYNGHIITNGTKHGLMMDDPTHDHGRGPDVDQMARLYSLLDGPTKAAVGEALRERLKGQADVDPVVLEAVDLAIDKARNGTEVTPETLDIVDRAMRSIERKLNAPKPSKPADPFDLPDTKDKRPNVPRAFYN